VAEQVLTELSDFGVSLWLDDLDRNRLDSGGLADLIANWHVRGVTTNPSIFDAAVAKGDLYTGAIREQARLGLNVEDIVWHLITTDVRDACDVFSPVWETSDGVDGRVSLEVDPRLAHDTAATIEQANHLWTVVNRPNALIKIPATLEGLPAITEAISRGISVNVTLIFSVDRYREVLAAYEEGLRQALERGQDLSKLQSVASFFISRVDSEIDAQLDAINSEPARILRGKAGIANARLAWQACADFTARPQWQELVRAGANPQRPLWASTGVKDPAYDDTRYVMELVTPGTVNTMPEATLQAVADHGVFRGDQVKDHVQQAQQVFTELGQIGIDIPGVFEQLEREGVQKFISAWEQLLTNVERAVRAE
jgi:transaldolase